MTSRQIILRIVGYHFSSGLTHTATLNLCLIYLKLLVHLLKQYGQYSCDFEVNQTKIKGGCQSGRKVVPHDSKSDLPLAIGVSTYVQRPNGQYCMFSANFRSNLRLASVQQLDCTLLVRIFCTSCRKGRAWKITSSFLVYQPLSGLEWTGFLTSRNLAANQKYIDQFCFLGWVLSQTLIYSQKFSQKTFM